MQKRIFFHDTDSGGVVYYANYLKYLEEARTEFLEQKGLSVADFHARELIYAVSECHIKYHHPARYAETLLCEARLKEATAVKLIFEQTIKEITTQKLLVTAEVTLVCLNKNFRPTPTPEDFKTRLLA